jgi:hypothetical protein
MKERVAYSDKFLERAQLVLFFKRELEMVKTSEKQYVNMALEHDG